MATDDFAAGLNLGLLPLDDTSFNQSRYPIKFCDHLCTGVPLLCSEVGEVGRLAHLFPWALRAGGSRTEWLKAFGETVDRLIRDGCPTADVSLMVKKLSWPPLAAELLAAYHKTLAATTGECFRRLGEAK
jgi:hypothetical protein